MRFVLSIVLFLISIFAATPQAAADIELLNSNLIVRMHLDDNPRRGQMIGAYIATLRPAGDTPLRKITLLLNPGLQFDKAEVDGVRLRATSAVKPIGGLDMLELNVVEIDLGRTLSAKNRSSNRDRLDIAIHFRGFIEDISWTGLDGVKETLNPRFTMLRAESFSYPVFADANLASIKKAWAHKGFYQSAAIEFPGTNTAVSNLIVESKALTANKMKADFNTDTPSGLMITAIGAYSDLKDGAVHVSYLDDNLNGARKYATLLNTEVSKTSALLGPLSGPMLKVIELPFGYKTSSQDAIFVDSDAMVSGQLSNSQKASISNSWKLNKTGRIGHWGGGLDHVLKVALAHPEMFDDYKMMQFTTAQTLFSAKKKIGTTALTDFVIDGFASDSDNVSALAFSVLYELLGRDQFFAVVRSLRSELKNGYADMDEAAKVMLKSIKNRKAKKLVKNWFTSGKAGKDMTKAKSFSELVALYR